MNRKTIFAALAVLLLSLLIPLSASAYVRDHLGDLHIEIVADNGRVLPLYEASRRARPDTLRAYLEAIRDQNFSIRVHNFKNERVGLVIAVDGRNIISGQKSYLKPRESMYILGPHEQAVYKGWRTASDRVNRFFFTDAKDSYAQAFGDDSAMGVISVVVYRERGRYRPFSSPKKLQRQRELEGRSSGDAAEAQSAAPAPGTGFGEEEYSQSFRVQFRAERSPVAKYFLKYEWRETLCRKGIIQCGQKPNRFWPEDTHDRYGFAPYPPAYHK